MNLALCFNISNIYFIQTLELQGSSNQSSLDLTVYKNFLDAKLQGKFDLLFVIYYFYFTILDMDSNEYVNYRNVLLLMLFDRWRHCRQMSITARNTLNLSSWTDINNDTFINDIYMLNGNTAYLTSMIDENCRTMVDKILVESLKERNFDLFSH